MAEYLANWSRKLQSEPRWIIEAAAQASKAADLILGQDPNGGSNEDDEEENAA